MPPSTSTRSSQGALQQKTPVPNASGGLVPMANVATVDEAVGPSVISLCNLHPAATISGRAAADISSGQTVDIPGKAAPRPN